MRRFVPFFLFLTLTSCSSCVPTNTWKETTDSDAIEAESLLDSTVVVKVTGPAVGFGSGVILHNDNEHSLVLTAGHVCIKDATFTLETTKGQQFPAVIILEDPGNDLCVLLASDLMEPTADLAGELPPVGARITHAGAPTGSFGYHLGMVVDGRYAGLEQMGDNYYIAMSLPIAPGSSGGGVYYKGKLFGIVTMAAIPNANISWGIELDHIKATMIEAENRLSHL